MSEPVAWITRKMWERLQERGWTEGRIMVEPAHDDYVPLYRTPAPDSEGERDLEAAGQLTIEDVVG